MHWIICVNWARKNHATFVTNIEKSLSILPRRVVPRLQWCKRLLPPAPQPDEKLNLLEMCFNAHSKVEDIGLGPRSGQARPAGDLSGHGLARSRLSTRSLTSPKLEINNSTQIHLQSLLSICIFGECRQLLETGTESGSRIIHSNSCNHETADEANTLSVDTAYLLCSAALQLCAVISLILLPDDCCIVVRRSDWIQSYKCLFLAEFDLIFTECDWDKQKHDTGWIVDYRHSAVPTENNTETQNYIAKLSSCVFLVAIRVLYLFLSELVTNSQPRQRRAPHTATRGAHKY